MFLEDHQSTDHFDECLHEFEYKPENTQLFSKLLGDPEVESNLDGGAQ